MDKQKTHEYFKADTANHTLKVVHDEGVNRHLVFSHNGSSNQRFDLITYAGGLVYRGDMGCYVFERLPDMFNFFRSQSGSINPYYWAEKLEAISRNDGYESFSMDRFLEYVEKDVQKKCESFEDDGESDKIQDFREAIQDALYYVDNEHSAYQMINDFEHNDWQFQDFFEHDLMEYEYRYIWACYAIVWGIQLYDEYKKLNFHQLLALRMRAFLFSEKNHV